MGVHWPRMSWAEKHELWHRWRRGETLDQVAQALHRGSSSIYDYNQRRPHSSLGHLTPDEYAQQRHVALPVEAASL